MNMNEIEMEPLIKSALAQSKVSDIPKALMAKPVGLNSGIETMKRGNYLPEDGAHLQTCMRAVPYQTVLIVTGIYTHIYGDGDNPSRWSANTFVRLLRKAIDAEIDSYQNHRELA